MGLGCLDTQSKAYKAQKVLGPYSIAEFVLLLKMRNVPATNLHVRVQRDSKKKK
jgi:hypothetical protein